MEDTIVDKAGDETLGQATMSERLFDLISSAIIAGEFKPGVGMTEPELARRYGVSRAPLREALRRLEERQLLERSPYRGMRVVEPSAQMIRDLYDIREVLEGLACRKAAAVITDADLARLRRTLAQERASIGTRAAAQADRAGAQGFLNFHTMIAQISGNGELLRLLNQDIWRLFRADYWRRVRKADALRQGNREHAAILRALEERDAELAELLMRRHIVNTRLQREASLPVQTDPLDAMPADD